MKILILLLCFAISAFNCHAVEDLDEKNEVRVLIVDGFNNHDWEKSTEAILSILSRDLSLITTVSTVPQLNSEAWKSWNPDFSNYDVIIQNTNDISKKGAWPNEAKIALEEYVSNGGGLLIFHSANNAFPDWNEYNKMIGLGWRNKNAGQAIIIQDDVPVIIPVGEGSNTSHGKRVDTVITRLGEHPIHAGLPRQWMAADLEVYRYARGPAENISVLSYTREHKTGLNFPVEWVIKYGMGRVYNSTFGHYWHKLSEDPPGIRCNGFQTILPRAVRWLAGLEVTSELPAEFPSKDQISLYKKH